MKLSNLSKAMALAWILMAGFSPILRACTPPLDCNPVAMASALEIDPEPTPRESYIYAHSRYFLSGVGIHPTSHLPVESINSLGQVDARTQPTLIGFYLQMLGARIKNEFPVDFLTRAQAISEADLILNQLLAIQQNFGWNGLIPWMYLAPLVPTTNTIGFVDNANLSQSVAVFIGALELSTNFAQKASLLDKANTFLNNQQAGYQAFYSTQAGRFHGSYDKGTRQFHPTYYIDRFMTEFRPAVAFIILRYGISNVAWYSLQITYKNYQLQGGEQVQNLVPYDGSAFQMFWPAMVSGEMAIPKMRTVLENYLASHMDFANRNKLPGILSACLVPEGVYYGKSGVPSAQETVDSLMVDSGSVYALAAAYSVNPAKVIEWLESIRAQAPAYFGAYGFYDSARTANDASNVYLGIDQASVVLGLLARSGVYFDRYLENRSLLASFRNLYTSRLPQLTAAVSTLANPPDIWNRATTVFQDAYVEGPLNGFPSAVSHPDGITISYQNVSSSTWGGHFWSINSFDARNKTLLVSFTSRITPGDFKIELKSGNTVRYTITVPAPQSETLGSVRVVIPNHVNYSAITTISVIVEPWRTGVRTADFHIHQLGFYTD